MFSKVNQISFSGNKILIIFAWFYEGGGFNDQQRFSLDPLNKRDLKQGRRNVRKPQRGWGA